MASTLDSHTKNYITTNHFYVEMGSSIVACFSECSGLGVDINKEVYFEGGVNDQQRVTLGHATFSDVSLKRGITDDQSFTKWLSKTFQKAERRNVSILVFNQAGELMQSWTLIGAVPIGWRVDALQADGDSVAIEELKLAIEGLKIGKSAGGGQSVSRDGSGYFV
ncbi:phage tail protein [Pseudanabaenaceae cyanobacterium LEGE 13415]|nr:phage tail protein [Pseudanabaenaceae cyanobacterium LEGE 13415]